MISEMLPGFRALIAKKLIEDHGMSQTQVAVMLDTTQPAISQYRRDLRGRKISVFLSNQRLTEQLERTANNIANGNVSPEKTGLEFCRMCKCMRDIGIVSGYSLC